MLAELNPTVLCEPAHASAVSLTAQPPRIAAIAGGHEALLLGCTVLGGRALSLVAARGRVGRIGLILTGAFAILLFGGGAAAFA